VSIIAIKFFAYVLPNLFLLDSFAYSFYS